MTEAEAIEALTQRWVDAWPALRPTVPFTFEGEVTDSADAWVRVTFLPTVRAQGTLGPEGSRRFESRGQVFAQIFAPLGAGVQLLHQLADDVRKVYEARRIADEIVTYAGTTRMGPGDGRWVMAVVTVPYTFDELR